LDPFIPVAKYVCYSVCFVIPACLRIWPLMSKPFHGFVFFLSFLSPPSSLSPSLQRKLIFIIADSSANTQIGTATPQPQSSVLPAPPYFAPGGYYSSPLTILCAFCLISLLPILQMAPILEFAAAKIVRENMDITLPRSRSYPAIH
jgi:hypothetical protein